MATAVAEIVGSYLPDLWPKKGASVGLLVPAAASLAVVFHVVRCDRRDS